MAESRFIGDGDSLAGPDWKKPKSLIDAARRGRRAEKAKARSRPSGAVQESVSYDPPASARNNAKKVLRWRDQHGDKVSGMTRVGWVRASQLARGDKISRATVGRMAAFARHRQNAVVNPEFKSEPWRDAGYVAWLGWGGDTGVSWAAEIVAREAKESVADQGGCKCNGKCGECQKLTEGAQNPVPRHHVIPAAHGPTEVRPVGECGLAPSLTRQVLEEALGSVTTTDEARAVIREVLGMDGAKPRH